MANSNEKRTLIFRLSSLGDVILSMSALESRVLPSQVDWVVSEEFAPLLKNHPRIENLWVYRRRAADQRGLFGWIKLCNELWAAQYDQVIDLHGSIRTQIARFLFWWWGRGRRRGEPVGLRRRPEWRTISKERFRTWGVVLLKKWLPNALRPTAYVTRYSRAAGGDGSERPNLSHLKRANLTAPLERLSAHLGSRAFYCVMPSSRWSGKEWGVEKFGAVIQSISGAIPVVLGTSDDRASLALEKYLQKKGIAHVSAIGQLNLVESANLLSRSMGILGNDTGLIHLAEAVGVPAYAVFGPSSPALGFGPWRKESVTFEAGLFCQPCSKTGRFCFRPRDRYACMKNLSAHHVGAELQSRWADRSEGGDGETSAKDAKDVAKASRVIQ